MSAMMCREGYMGDWWGEVGRKTGSGCGGVDVT